MQRLGGSHVDSVRKRCDDQSGTVSKIFVVIFKLGVRDFDLSVTTFAVVVKFELRLPLKFVCLSDFLVQQSDHDVSGVSVEGN